MIALDEVQLARPRGELLAAIVDRSNRDETARRRDRSRRCARRARALPSICSACSVSLVFATRDCREHPEHARQQHAGALERDDRVVERRRGGCCGDRRDFGEVLPHPLFDRRLVVGVANPIERRERRTEACSARRTDCRVRDTLVVDAVDTSLKRRLSPAHTHQAHASADQQGSESRIVGPVPFSADGTTSLAGAAASIPGLGGTKAQIPREPQRSRKREEHKRKANRQHDRHDLDGVHGWCGHDAMIHTIGTPIATNSPATRLNTYAPIQKSDCSPRSSARPHVGQRPAS